MRARSILFPTDFSTLSNAGLECAAALARDTGAKLLIVHVQEPPLAYAAGGELYYGKPEPDREALQKMLDELAPDDPGVRCERHLLVGEPVIEIVKFARERDVDMIVMSSHGRTGWRRMLLGSVAEFVVRRAPCPVLVVKPAWEEHFAARQVDSQLCARRHD